jgi:hypothetical protein
MKIKFTCFFLLVITLFEFNCTNLTYGGNGSETTNGYVIGKLVEDEGVPARQTRVMLIKSNHDQVKDGPIADSLIDTTDEAGEFKLHIGTGGIFNVEAFQPATGKRILITALPVYQNDTLEVPVRKLQKPGIIRCLLPFMKASADGYVYINGTTHFALINNGNALIDSVPAGDISSVSYSEVHDTTKDSLIASGVNVVADNTTVIANTSVWKYSKIFHLNTTGSGAEIAGRVLNFPVLVRLTSANFDFGQARTDGSDLRFAKGSGDPLSFEIERWDPITQQAEVWVKIDTVFGNDATHSYLMYWGASTPSISSGTVTISESNGAAVFDTSLGFAGVWHMNQVTDAKVSDATANSIDGTASFTTTTSGTIGMAQSFNGQTSKVQASGSTSDKLNFPENSAFSISAWVKTLVLDSVLHAILFKSNYQYALQILPENKWEFFNFIDKTRWESSRAPAEAAAWVLLTGVRNGTKQYLYIDGTCVDSSVITTPDPSGITRTYNKPFEIGHCSDGGLNNDRYFNGIIDEVRVEKTARPADWIKLCFKNQNSQDALVKW